MPAGILQDTPASDAHTDHDARNHEGQQNRCDGCSQPGPQGRQRVEHRRRQRAVIFEHHGRATHRKPRSPQTEEAERSNEGAHQDARPRALHDDDFGKQHRDEAVGSDDVTRKEQGMHAAEYQHPQAAATD